MPGYFPAIPQPADPAIDPLPQSIGPGLPGYVGLGSADCSLRPGARGGAAAQLQQLLRDANFYTGPADGTVDAETRAGVVKAQRTFISSSLPQVRRLAGLISLDKSCAVAVQQIGAALALETLAAGGGQAPMAETVTHFGAADAAAVERSMSAGGTGPVDMEMAAAMAGY